MKKKLTGQQVIGVPGRLLASGPVVYKPEEIKAVIDGLDNHYRKMYNNDLDRVNAALAGIACFLIKAMMKNVDTQLILKTIIDEITDSDS
jgi:hypothetical protein